MMRRRHLPVSQVQFGARVFVVPREAGMPRGPHLDAIPAGGAELVVDDYVFGAIQRGALTAYEAKECSAEELQAHEALLLAGYPREPQDDGKAPDTDPSPAPGSATPHEPVPEPAEPPAESPPASEEVK
jgi:hypothetical protein